MLLQPWPVLPLISSIQGDDSCYSPKDDLPVHLPGAQDYLRAVEVAQPQIMPPLRYPFCYQVGRPCTGHLNDFMELYLHASYSFRSRDSLGNQPCIFSKSFRSIRHVVANRAVDCGLHVKLTKYDTHGCGSQHPGSSRSECCRVYTCSSCVGQIRMALVFLGNFWLDATALMMSTQWKI